MKSKKILSLMLALVMTMALAVPAFAAVDQITDANVTDISKGANVKITGTTEAPTIKVKVPTTGGLIANPYKLTVKKTDENGLAADSNAVVISPAQYIESQSNIPLWVSGTVTGTPSTDVKLLAEDKEDAAAWAAASKTKDMYLYFQMAVATAAGTEPTWATLNTTAGSENGLIVAAKSVTIPANLAKTAKLAEVTINDDGEAQATSCVAFRLAGNLATNLSTGTWGTKDKVDVAIAFTFLPSEPVVS